GAPLLGLGLALENGVDRLLTQLTTLGLERVRQVVHRSPLAGLRRRLDGGCRLGHGREQNSDTRDHRGAKQSCDYFAHYIPPLAYADALCAANRRSSAPGVRGPSERMQTEKCVKDV